MQLDDWVLCRLYNKKGSIEKHSPAADRKLVKYPETEEDQKPNILLYGHKGIAPAQYSTLAESMVNHNNDDLSAHMDTTSDSMPRLHTDSSCSEHVLSPEFTCEKEVQSEPAWNQLYSNAFDFGLGYVDEFQDDPFASQVQFQMDQLSPLQDMFMFLQKPF